MDVHQLALGHEGLVIWKQGCEDEAAEHEPLGLGNGLARWQQPWPSRRRRHVQLQSLASAQHGVLDD